MISTILYMDMFECFCCLEHYPIGQRVYYQLHQDTMWHEIDYCNECVTEVIRTRWDIIKGNLIGSDCLSAFRNVCRHGISLWLTVNQVSYGASNGNESICKFKRNTGRFEIIQSAKLTSDITEEQRDQLVEELRALEKAGGMGGTEVTDYAIRAICGKYWPEARPEPLEQETHRMDLFYYPDRWLALALKCPSLMA